jgi:hypothetical protein
MVMAFPRDDTAIIMEEPVDEPVVLADGVETRAAVVEDMSRVGGRKDWILAL